MRVRFASLVAAVALAGCSNVPEMQTKAPSATSSTADAAAATVTLAEMTPEQILARMSLERKIAQLIMPDISAITPADVEKYRFGTILNGGNSGPGGNDKAHAPEWLALADAFWEASSKPLANGEPAIPALWATDAVHGHTNIPGATIFPQNIALGATGDADLMRRIGEATAAEIAVTGIDWTFAPTLAVATDDRWGRTYESFSENPELVAKLGTPTIIGFQGQPGTEGFLDQSRVIATAKHFYGDGGTGGKDRGNTRGTAEELRATHLYPYPPAIAVDVQTVMSSFSSVNGVKMHGSKEMLTGTLRDDLGFGGLVVGDWNGHGELDGCTNSDCPQSLMAGLDIFMVPEDWKGLYESLLAQVADGTIPQSRVDEAVLRVLKVKHAYGLFAKPKPSQRLLAGQFDLLGSDNHRAIAREAVRKSLVLLKNDGVLPLKPSANIIVAGAGANSVANQSGGWTITWQGGGDLTAADFPGATDIFTGLSDALRKGGGNAVLEDSDAPRDSNPDAAIVVFGEEPYAEFVGDREDLAFRDEQGLQLLEKYKGQGIPTVAVFLSGRPLWVNRELSAADAFVAAWLPGSEGGGIADVLIGNEDGTPRHDFTGKLSFGWPAGCAPGSANLFDFGEGGSYAAAPANKVLDLECDLLDQSFDEGLEIFELGLSQSVTAKLSDAGATRSARAANLVGASPGGNMVIRAFDRAAQEDARRVTWSGPGAVAFNWSGGSVPPQGALVMRVKVDARPGSTISLSAGDGDQAAVNLTSSFDLASGKDWRNINIPLSCLSDSEISGLTLASDGAFTFDFDLIGLVPHSASEDCNGPF